MPAAESHRSLVVLFAVIGCWPAVARAWPRDWVAPVRDCRQETNECNRDDCGFGYHCDGTSGRRVHTGIDLAGDAGTTVRAPFSGTVQDAGWRKGYGGYVIIESDDRTAVVLLAHLQCETGCLAPDSCVGREDNEDRSCNAVVNVHVDAGASAVHVDAGARIGMIGRAYSPRQNGNWKNHVHLTLIHGPYEPARDSRDAPTWSEAHWRFRGYDDGASLCHFANPWPDLVARGCRLAPQGAPPAFDGEEVATQEGTYSSNPSSRTAPRLECSPTPRRVETCGGGSENGNMTVDEGLGVTQCPGRGTGAWVPSCPTAFPTTDACRGFHILTPIPAGASFMTLSTQVSAIRSYVSSAALPAGARATDDGGAGTGCRSSVRPAMSAWRDRASGVETADTELLE